MAQSPAAGKARVAYCVISSLLLAPVQLRLASCGLPAMQLLLSMGFSAATDGRPVVLLPAVVEEEHTAPAAASEAVRLIGALTYLYLVATADTYASQVKGQPLDKRYLMQMMSCSSTPLALSANRTLCWSCRSQALTRRRASWTTGSAGSTP